MGHIAFIGIGSNIGDKLQRCEEAVSEILAADRHQLLSKSSYFKTRPVGCSFQDWFVNGVIEIETDLEAPELLLFLKNIEARLGRSVTFRWGPRTIDLDILFFDEKEINTVELQVPHPRIQDRQFVLVPLVEINPSLVHPTLKKTVQELLDNLEEDQGVERLAPSDSTGTVLMRSC